MGTGLRALFASLALVTSVAGCGLTLDLDPPDRDGGLDGLDAHLDDASAPLDATPVDSGRDAGSDAELADAAPGDAGLADATLDASAGECASTLECIERNGDPPCGSWACVAGRCEVDCPGCRDDDRDGFGVGASCAGPDCDDADDAVFDRAIAPCYEGPPGTEGVGVCAHGQQVCGSGRWSECVSQRVPTAESCNGRDDDCDGAVDDEQPAIVCGLGVCASPVSSCTASGTLAVCPAAPVAPDVCGGLDEDCDGAVDEDCPMGCVWVSTTGSDGSPNPMMPSTPLRTVQAAIDRADAAGGARICLLTPSCTAPAVFRGAVQMRDGVSVIGGWLAAAVPTRCTTTPPSTVLAPGTASGIRFDADIGAEGAQLIDVGVQPHIASDVAAITIDGATRVTIAGVFVGTHESGASGISRSRGIQLVHGAEALITRSQVLAGRGIELAAGVESIGSRPVLVANCDMLDASGRCIQQCGAVGAMGTSVLGIRGRLDSSGTRAAETYGVLLHDSGGARVDGTAVCGVVGDRGVGIAISGASADVLVRGSFVAAWGPEMLAYGIDATDCEDASPAILDNVEINAEGGSLALQAGVHASGRCHPVIDGNGSIRAALEGRGSGYGIKCTDGARCVIEDDALVQGSSAGVPELSTGVACESGGCARIERSGIDGAQGVDTVGLLIDRSSPFVDRVRASGGCASGSATGIRIVDASPRIQNVIATGGRCLMVSGGPRVVYAMSVETGGGLAMPDVHSSTLDAGGFMGSCSGAALEMHAGAGSAGGRTGVFRNVIFHAGVCGSRVAVIESAPGVDPLVVSHCDLDRTGLSSIYRDEGGSDLASIALVNALSDMLSVGNVDGAPAFVTYPTDLRLGAGSAARGAGTPEGAPLRDFAGTMRSATAPSIGAYE